MTNDMLIAGQLPLAFYQLAVYTLVTLALIGVLLLAARWLGDRRHTPQKDLPYESGVVPSGSARLAWPVPFYLVAIFFIVFDVEAAFIFTWAVANDLLGLSGLIHITVFIVVLAAGLVWLWLKGGLDWGPSRGSRLEVQGSRLEVQGSRNGEQGTRNGVWAAGGKNA